MTYEEFLDAVQERARLADHGQAEKLTRATLQTLRERLAGNEPQHLGTQLPPELAQELTGMGKGESFPVEEFCARVSERAGGLDNPQPAVSAVFTVIEDVVAGGEVEDLRAQLPSEYSSLLARA